MKWSACRTFSSSAASFTWPDKFTIIIQDGKEFVAMKPMVEGMGLVWNNQPRNIKEDSSLAPVMLTISTTGSDGKHYDMVCLPLGYAAGTVLS